MYNTLKKRTQLVSIVLELTLNNTVQMNSKGIQQRQFKHILRKILEN